MERKLGIIRINRICCAKRDQRRGGLILEQLDNCFALLIGVVGMFLVDCTNSSISFIRISVTGRGKVGSCASMVIAKSPVCTMDG